MNSAQGTLNRWRAEADKLPAPVSVGMWIRRGNVVFTTVAGTDEHGAPALAWQADATLFFRPTLISAR